MGKFKNKYVLKVQQGRKLKNFINWWDNIVSTGAVTENPSIMTASGWRLNNGKAIQDLQQNKEVVLLRDNLKTIGEAAITAPTMAEDIQGLYLIVRHPIKSFLFAKKGVLDVLWFLRNPKAIKVYHVNRQGEYFPLLEARTGSPSNIGIHVTPKKEIARSFNRDAPIMEAYIPREDMETIDIWGNDYNLFSNNYLMLRTNGQFSWNDPKGLGASIINYSTTPSDKLRFNLIKKYGGNPSVSDDGFCLYLDNDVTIPLLKETWPNMPIKVRQLMDDIISEGKSLHLKSDETFRTKAQRLNQQAAKIASDNGKKSNQI